LGTYADGYARCTADVVAWLTKRWQEGNATQSPKLLASAVERGVHKGAAREAEATASSEGAAREER
jgi:hypothetical protein